MPRPAVELRRIYRRFGVLGRRIDDDDVACVIGAPLEGRVGMAKVPAPALRSRMVLRVPAWENDSMAEKKPGADADRWLKLATDERKGRSPD